MVFRFRLGLAVLTLASSIISASAFGSSKRITIQQLKSPAAALNLHNLLHDSHGILRISLDDSNNDDGGFANLRKRSLRSLCDCPTFTSSSNFLDALQSHPKDLQQIHLHDGTIRRTLASATVGFDNDEEEGEVASVLELPAWVQDTCGQDAYESFEDLRDAVADVVGVFMERLDGEKSGGQGRIEEESYRQILSTANHLEHFHVYTKKSTGPPSSQLGGGSLKKETSTLDYHTDAGFFLSFVPAMNCHSYTTDNDSFYLKGQNDPLHFGDADVVIMMGAGAQYWLPAPSEGQQSPFLAASHALRLSADTRRSWYGKMHLLPASFTAKNVSPQFLSSTPFPAEEEEGVFTSLELLETGRRLQNHVASPAYCNNETNFFCWHQCLDIPDAINAEQYANDGKALYCIDPSRLADSLVDAYYPCSGGYIHNSRCKGVWYEADVDIPGYKLLYEVKTEERHNHTEHGASTSPNALLSSSVSPSMSVHTPPLAEKATNQPSLSPVVLEKTFGQYEITPFIMILSKSDKSQPASPHLRELEEVTSKFLRSIFSDEIGVDNSVYITTLKAYTVEESTLQASINVDQSLNNDAAVRRAKTATADTLTYLEVDGIIAIRDLIFDNPESVEQFITATLSSAFQLRDELLGLLQDSSNPFLRSASMVELSDSIEICSNGLRCHHRSKCFTGGGGQVVVCDCSTASPLEAYDGYQCEFSATQFCSSDLTVGPYSFCTNRGECLRSSVTAKEPHPGCICTDNFEGSRCQIVKDLSTDKSKDFVSRQESPIVLRAGDYIIIAIICIGLVLTTAIIVYKMKAGDGKNQIVSNRDAVESNTNNTSRVAAMEAGLGEKPSVQKVDNEPPRPKGLEEEKEEIVADPETDYEVSATKESQSASNGSIVTERVEEEVRNASLELDQGDSVVAKDGASDADSLVNPEKVDEEIAAQSKHGDKQGHDGNDESNSNHEVESPWSQPDKNEASKVWEKAMAKHGKE